MPNIPAPGGGTPEDVPVLAGVENQRRDRGAGGEPGFSSSPLETAAASHGGGVRTAPVPPRARYRHPRAAAAGVCEGAWDGEMQGGMDTGKEGWRDTGKER